MAKKKYTVTVQPFIGANSFEDALFTASATPKPDGRTKAGKQAAAIIQNAKEALAGVAMNAEEDSDYSKEALGLSGQIVANVDSASSFDVTIKLKSTTESPIED